MGAPERILKRTSVECGILGPLALMDGHPIVCQPLPIEQTSTPKANRENSSPDVTQLPTGPTIVASPK